MSEDRAHSPLGGSGAARWMSCPGSIVLAKKLGDALPPEQEADFRAEGSAAHEAAAECLLSGEDSWTLIGQEYLGVEVSVEMADAVQLYLDTVRPLMTATSSYWVEEEFGHELKDRPHPAFYGHIDFGCVDGDVMHVYDYKHGAGIAVDPENNAQLMYYAYGLLRRFPSVGEVILGIVQPRAFHPEGPIRIWSTTGGEILNWAETELIPAMERAEVDETFAAGDHCRFCPARAVCPMLGAMFGAAATADKSAAPNMSLDRLALEYAQITAVSIYIKAIKDELTRRLMAGETDEHVKLVKSRANRVWKDGVEDTLKEKLGDAIYTKPALKSPAEISKLGADAKALAAEYAYSPDTGLTLAAASDKRGSVKVEKATDTFSAFATNTE